MYSSFHFGDFLIGLYAFQLTLMQTEMARTIANNKQSPHNDSINLNQYFSSTHHSFFTAKPINSITSKSKASWQVIIHNSHARRLQCNLEDQVSLPSSHEEPILCIASSYHQLNYYTKCNRRKHAKTPET